MFYALSLRLNAGPDPPSSGGYMDVYEGTLDASIVCVKRVRASTRGFPQKATEVRSSTFVSAVFR